MWKEQLNPHKISLFTLKCKILTSQVLSLVTVYFSMSSYSNANKLLHQRQLTWHQGFIAFCFSKASKVYFSNMQPQIFSNVSQNITIPYFSRSNYQFDNNDDVLHFISASLYIGTSITELSRNWYSAIAWVRSLQKTILKAWNVDN